MLIGWFPVEAAQAARLRWMTTELLSDLRVKDVMARDCAAVPGGLDLRTFVEDHVLRSASRCYVVEDDGHATGLLTPHEIKTVGRKRWPEVAVRDAMRPLPELRTVRPETPVSEAWS